MSMRRLAECRGQIRGYVLSRILTFGRMLGRDNMEDNGGPSLGAVEP